MIRLFLSAVLFAVPTFAEVWAKEPETILSRIKPTEPDRTIGDFEIAAGFAIQLVASEPMITSPVAIAWAADGALFVCEMRGYSEHRDDRISRITRLVDQDGDGIYDRRTVFAENLLWPTAIFPYDGGLFVADAPDIFWIKDTDGDGRADEKKVVLTGFGTSNVQGLLNSFRWGLDNRIHVACSSNGGKISRPESRDSIINVRGRDLSFDPRSMEFAATSGGGQHGMSFDDWGRKFASSNSDHLQQVLYDDRYVARNPFMAAPPARVSIAVDGPQAEVFRISPVEPWRILRTHLRVTGAASGPIEGGGRAAGYFTGATGVTIYRGDAWPESERGVAIVGDVGSNLVHRKRLQFSGVQATATRIDPDHEFVASADIWFRPAQFECGPDGTLHVIDVCREVIEHPKSLPPIIKEQVDLNAGRDRGRLYRIIPQGYQHRRTANLNSLSSENLAELLTHPNAWHRETASRLLYQRQDLSVIGVLRRIAGSSPSPLGRLHALATLDGMKQVTASELEAGLIDPHPGVRRLAVKLAEKKLEQPAILDLLLRMVDDESIDVRYQLAFTLGQTNDPRRLPALVNLIRHGVSDPSMAMAVQSSLAVEADSVFTALVSDSDFREPSAQRFLESLADQIRAADRDAEIKRAIAAIVKMNADDGPLALSLGGRLGGGSNAMPESLSRTMGLMIQAAIQRASDEGASQSDRLAAIASLRYGDASVVAAELETLINSRHSDAVQRIAIETLGRVERADGVGGADVVQPILGVWAGLSPGLRQVATEVLFARRERVSQVANAISEGVISMGDLPESRWTQVVESAPPRVAAELQDWIDERQSIDPGEWMADYAEATNGGDADAGKVVFAQHCAVCHRVGETGYELGPNLASMRSRGAASILASVLDPNAEVNPQYVNYLVLLEDGRSVTGMIQGESASSVTLLRGHEQSDTVVRTQIERMQSSGKSLMPEGFQRLINPDQMADLIAFLMSNP